MHSISGNDIELTRGDSLLLRVRINGDTPAGTTAEFTVKKNVRDETPVIFKAMDVANGNVVIHLEPADTDIPVGTYYWDMRLCVPENNGIPALVVTPMEYASLQILDAVGDGFVEVLS